jgi:hypothetical protein
VVDNSWFVYNFLVIFGQHWLELLLKENCFILSNERGARGGAVGWDTALQAGRSLVRSPMSSGFFIDIIRPYCGPTVDSAS